MKRQCQRLRKDKLNRIKNEWEIPTKKGKRGGKKSGGAPKSLKQTRKEEQEREKWEQALKDDEQEDEAELFDILDFGEDPDTGDLERMITEYLEEDGSLDMVIDPQEHQTLDMMVAENGVDCATGTWCLEKDCG